MNERKFYVITNADGTLFFQVFTDHDTAFMSSNIEDAEQHTEPGDVISTLEMLRSTKVRYLGDDDDEPVTIRKLKVAEVVVNYTINKNFDEDWLLMT